MNKKQIGIQICSLLGMLLLFTLNYLWIGSQRAFTEMEILQMMLAALSIVLFDFVFTDLVAEKQAKNQFVIISTTIITMIYILYQVIMSFITPMVDFNTRWFLTYHIIAAFLLLFSYTLVFIFINQSKKERK